jgi:hypothetical protein
MTEIEQGYVDQGYTLPQGYTWAIVAARRAEWRIGEIYVPVATGGGACAWGVPMIDGKFLEHHEP